jgi:hypothetical protein
MHDSSGPGRARATKIIGETRAIWTGFGGFAQSGMEPVPYCVVRCPTSGFPHTVNLLELPGSRTLVTVRCHARLTVGIEPMTRLGSER